MNFEQHDNLLLADWTFQGSLLGSLADNEIGQLEDLIEVSLDLYSRGLIQAVLWIQKVPYTDFCMHWLNELKDDLLRDDLRWRMARLYCLRRSIQESPIPWLYLSENNCLGALAELMFACQRRFVFDTETWFGFPELSIDQLPTSGWLAHQLQRKPKLLDVWKRKSVWKAEEAVQFGLIDAALSWQDWRLELFPWATRQIEMWELETSSRGRHAVRWKPLERLWSERTSILQKKTQIDAYIERSSRRLESQTGVDAELIDSVSHFIFQAPYEIWLKRGVRAVEHEIQKIEATLIYLDISEALAPISLVARLLDSGFKLAFFAEKAEVLKKNLELSLAQIESRYRRHALQLFEKQISWYVGSRSHQPQFLTFSFGYFRNVTFSFKETEIRGWILSAQKMDRQVLEVSSDKSNGIEFLKPFFDAVYRVKNLTAAVPLIYLVKSLCLQIVIEYSRLTGENIDVVLEQLRGTDWSLLGSQRHWERFLEYRSSLSVLSNLSVPDSIGSLIFNKSYLSLYSWSDVRESSQSNKSMLFKRGPGYLHNLLSSFSVTLIQELISDNWIENHLDGALYVADALGYPTSWGGAELFSRRIGIRTDFGLLRQMFS